jgi:hypothetical protein
MAKTSSYAFFALHHGASRLRAECFLHPNKSFQRVTKRFFDRTNIHTNYPTMAAGPSSDSADFTRPVNRRARIPEAAQMPRGEPPAWINTGPCGDGTTLSHLEDIVPHG